MPSSSVSIGKPRALASRWAWLLFSAAVAAPACSRSGLDSLDDTRSIDPSAGADSGGEGGVGQGGGGQGGTGAGQGGSGARGGTGAVGGGRGGAGVGGTGALGWGGQGGAAAGASFGGAAGAGGIDWGCEGAGDPVPVEPISDAVLLEFVAVACARIVVCSPGYYPSEQYCRDVTACSRGTVRSAGVTEARLVACTEQIARTSRCPASTDFGCPLHEGTAGLGERCNQTPCAEGLYCHYGTAEQCPVCLPRRAVGEPCTTTPECARDHFCAPGSSVCAPLRQVDEACSADSDCSLARCLDGTCQRFLTPGEACQDARACGNGLQCVDGACAFVAAEPGEPCDAVTPCALGVCTQGVCEAICVTGELVPGRCATSADCPPDEYCAAPGARCTPRLAPGQPCTSFTQNCAVGHRCDAATRTCVPLRQNGAPCSFAAECVTTYCLHGRCAPQCACEMP